MRQEKIWLIGSGHMAMDYAKVLMDQCLDFQVVGRGEESAKTFEAAIGHPVATGGLKAWLERDHAVPDAAIVTVDMEVMHEIAAALLKTGVRRLLLEIPGGLDSAEIRDLARQADNAGATVLVAYNRRFYTSVQELRKRVLEDGGATSLFFEFTEWRHVIERLRKPDIVKNHWFYANSVHVMDTAFFLCGAPEELTCYHAGELSWHSPVVFCGAGVTEANIPFSYHANWAAPGRWGIEVCTALHRYYLRPMEKLHVQDLGSLAVNPVVLDDELDVRFKPGLYREVECLISDSLHPDALTIQHHAAMCPIYDRISGYDRLGAWRRKESVATLSSPGK